MGFRFQKRIKLFPGVRLNLSNGSPSLSIGARGASLTVGKRGVYANAGIPGSGLSHRTRLDKPNGSRRSAEADRPPATTERLPPARFNLQIVGGVPDYLDEQNRPLGAEEIALIKRTYKDQLLEQFDARVVALNNAREALGHLHHQMPPPCRPAPVPMTAGKAHPAIYPAPKPQRPDDPDALPSFMERLSAWRVAKAEYESQHSDSVGATEPDLAAIAEPILQLLGGIEWPRETSIDLDLCEDGTTLILHVDLPEIEDIPAAIYAVSRFAVDITQKPASASNVADLYARHVHAIALRLIGEAYAASGVIQYVQFDGYTQRISSATGRFGDEYVLSVRVPRAQWCAIDFGNLAAIDPVNALDRFDLRRNMLSRGHLKPVTPFR